MVATILHSVVQAHVAAGRADITLLLEAACDAAARNVRGLYGSIHINDAVTHFALCALPGKVSTFECQTVLSNEKLRSGCLDKSRRELGQGKIAQYVNAESSE